MIYLDANATEPLRPEARTSMLEALDECGNPASVHRSGRAVRRRLEDVRERLASRYGARETEVVFTSGGTEADALALHALGSDRRIAIGATEHDAVRAAAPHAVSIPVDRQGVVQLDALEELLADGQPTLVCLMLANNETGTIQPVHEAAMLCRQHRALLHVDAVQAAGRIEVDLAALGAHSLALSSHKVGGPAGAGALVTSPEVSIIAPMMPGGGQERGRRGGTPPVAAIAGFGAAAECDADGPRLSALRDAIDRAAIGVGAMVCGSGAERLPNTTCLALPGVRSDLQVITLDLAGFAVSAGAACNSGKIGSSHVLSAMGLEDVARQAIRVSLPWNVRDADVTSFIAGYCAMVAQVGPIGERRSRPSRAA